MITAILTGISIFSCLAFLMTICAEMYSTHMNDRKIADILKATTRCSALNTAWNRFALHKPAGF